MRSLGLIEFKILISMTTKLLYRMPPSSKTMALLLLFALLGLTHTTISQTQPPCNFGGSQFPVTTFSNPSTSFTTVATNIYAGEYQLYSVVSGLTYEWSYCTSDGGNAAGEDLVMTLFNNTTGAVITYGDDECGSYGPPKITWLSSFTGTVRVLTTLYPCSTNSINHTLVWRMVSGGSQNGCNTGTPNDSPYFTPGCTGSQEEYAYFSYFGEYNTVILSANTNYLLGTTGGGYITVTNSTNSILAYGVEPINFTPTTSGAYMVHLFANSSCSTTGSPGTPWIQCSNATPPSSPTAVNTNSTSICVGQSTTLTVSGGVGTTYWFSGSCASSTSASIGSGSSINVSPTITTTYYARNYQNSTWSTSCATVTITVVQPVAPSAPSSNSPQCGSVTITRNGTPPTGTTWYWQGTNSNGTSTSLGSGTTFTATSSGTYYIRALSNVGCWSSSSSSVSVVVNSIPGNPSVLSSNSPQCGAVSIQYSGSPPAGTTWYWQGQNSLGTSTTNGSGSTYSVSSSGTYYLRALNSGGCWSQGSSSITVSVGAAPSTPVNPTSNSPHCGSVTLQFSAAPPAGTTWYWQGTNSNGTSLAQGSGNTYEVYASGTYYLRALNSAGCWSNVSAALNVIVSEIPPAPYNITSNSPQCGSVNLSYSISPPMGVIWYWQGTNSNGTSTSVGSSNNIAIEETGVYYSRALSNEGCWSNSSTSVSVTVYPLPEMPIAPVSNSPQCEVVTISAVTAPPSGVSWYWQGNNSDGTSQTTNSNSVYTVTSSGSYFIRSRSQQNCWSQYSASVDVTVAGYPNAPQGFSSNSPQCEEAIISGPMPPEGTLYYWQANNSNGNSTDLGVGNSFIVGTTDTYYLAAMNLPNCWSNTNTSIPVIIAGYPDPPVEPTSNSPQCEEVIIFPASPSDGSAWFWQGANAFGTSTVQSAENNYTATSSGTYYLRAVNEYNCWSNNSSSVTVTVKLPTEHNDVQSHCVEYTWINNSTYSASTNTPQYIIESGAYNGCDSIIHLDLTIHPNYDVDTDIQACETYTWSNGQNYTQSIETSYVFTTSYGCDSLVHLNLDIVYPSDTMFIQTTAINEYSLNGIPYDETGIYTQTLENEWGCDSIVQLNLYIENLGASDISKKDYYIYPTVSPEGIFYTNMPIEDYLELRIFNTLGGEVSYDYTAGAIMLTQPVKSGYLMQMVSKNGDIIYTFRCVVN